jgi:small subunit ribosomal protein S2
MAVVTMRQLLESGVHFGHQTRRWNPKMKRFIMTERNGIYIIDLQQSLAYIDRSYAFIKETVAKGGTVMFVGTKKQAQEAIAEQAIRVGMPYVNQRWLGGMLTNFQTVHQRINRLKELDEVDFEDVAGSSRTKKELLQMRRERDKLNKSLGGIREMSRTPSAVWIVDTNKEHLAVEEARKLHIPIIGILDSNCDPDVVDFPIPGNDDAIRAVGLLTRVVADAVAEGLIARSGAKTDGAEAGAEEPLAEWERELLGGDAKKAAASGDAASGDATAETPAAEATGAAVAGAQADEAGAAEKAVVSTKSTDEGSPSDEGSSTDEPAEGPADVIAEVATTAPEQVVTEAVVSTSSTDGDAGSTGSESSTDGDAGSTGSDGGFGADSAAPLEDGSAPEGFEIKGNKNSMKFHAPSSPWYARTNAEVWFRTAEAAEAAGFANAESGDAVVSTGSTDGDAGASTGSTDGDAGVSTGSTDGDAEATQA